MIGSGSWRQKKLDVEIQAMRSLMSLMVLTSCPVASKIVRKRALQSICGNTHCESRYGKGHTPVISSIQGVVGCCCLIINV